MKKMTIGLIAFLGVVTSLFSAPSNSKSTYKMLKDIYYQTGDESKQTQYMKEQCKLDLLLPQNTNNFTTLIWFHGGGLKAGDKKLHYYFKKDNVAVVSVNYRLSPKVKCPVYIEDAAAAVAWVFRNISKYGGNPQKIFISGHSAGGYLASMVGLDKKWLAQYNVDADEIAGLIPMSGHTITHFTIRNERGIGNKRVIVDEYAPIYHARKDAPPILLITGDKNMEMLGRYEENAYMMRMLKVNGHKDTTLYELQGYGHSMVVPARHMLFKFIRRIGKQIDMKK